MISSLTSSPTSSAPSQPGGAPLGKQDFLKLLITQLRNQDPLNPLDQNQFLAQTAQFTSLENLQNISGQLAEMTKLAQGTTFAQGASLLGKTAAAAGRDFALGSAPASLPFLLAGSGSVQIDILGSQNTVVRHLSTGPLEAGAQAVAWDGLDSAGQAMSPGTYHYRVAADGGAVAVAAQGTLTGMTPSTGGTVYHLGDAIVRADDLITVG
jgi:flagellar basal-body rod modification protein FlgD